MFCLNLRTAKPYYLRTGKHLYEINDNLSGVKTVDVLKKNVNDVGIFLNQIVLNEENINLLQK